MGCKKKKEGKTDFSISDTMTQRKGVISIREVKQKVK